MADHVVELASLHNLADADTLEVYSKVVPALREAFGQCDSGVGEGYCDFWIKHKDVEYKLVLTTARTLKAPS